MTDYLASFQKEVDRKYKTILTKFTEKLTHPKREVETTLGNLFADSFAEIAESDVALIGSGSIRVKELGPVVTLGDYIACFPYDDSYSRYVVTGSQLTKIFSYIMRKSNRDGEGECYQINSEVKAVYDDKKDELVSLLIKNVPVVSTQFYTISLQGFHFKSSQSYLNISNEELLSSQKTKVITTSVQDTLKEYLRNHQNISKKITGRLIY